LIKPQSHIIEWLVSLCLLYVVPHSNNIVTDLTILYEDHWMSTYFML